MNGDEDIHLVIAEPSHPTQEMVVELPKCGCIPESNSTKAAKMDAARAAFIAACGLSPNGSFKFLHGHGHDHRCRLLRHSGGAGQTGHSPHNRDLHSVLSFEAKAC